MNSTLQALLHCKLFTAWLYAAGACVAARAGQHQLPNTRWNLLYALMSLAAHMMQPAATAQRSAAGAMSPTEIAHHLSVIGPTLHLGSQEDAHEFLAALLDTLERHAVRVGMAPCGLLRGTLVSRVTCTVCGHFSDKEDPFETLSLEIRDAASISDALRHFTAVERLCGDNQYFCEHCKTKRDADKGMLLAAAPDILALNLKRFSYGRGMSSWSSGQKLTHHVEFPRILHVDEFSTSKVPATYTLRAVLVHAGGTPVSGHYYSHVFSTPTADAEAVACGGGGGVAAAREQAAARDRALFDQFLKPAAKSQEPQQATSPSDFEFYHAPRSLAQGLADVAATEADSAWEMNDSYVGARTPQAALGSRAYMLFYERLEAPIPAPSQALLARVPRSVAQSSEPASEPASQQSSIPPAGHAASAVPPHSPALSAPRTVAAASAVPTSRASTPAAVPPSPSAPAPSLQLTARWKPPSSLSVASSIPPPPPVPRAALGASAAGASGPSRSEPAASASTRAKLTGATSPGSGAGHATPSPPKSSPTASSHIASFRRPGTGSAGAASQSTLGKFSMASRLNDVGEKRSRSTMELSAGLGKQPSLSSPFTGTSQLRSARPSSFTGMKSLCPR